MLWRRKQDVLFFVKKVVFIRLAFLSINLVFFVLLAFVFLYVYFYIISAGIMYTLVGMSDVNLTKAEQPQPVCD